MKLYFLALAILAASASNCLRRFSNLATVLSPMTPPPHLRTTVVLNWAWKFS